MSDLGLQARDVRKQPDQLPAEGRLGSSGKHKQAAALSFFFACLAFFEYMPLVWHWEASNLISTRKQGLLASFSGHKESFLE
jgi:hypothetical protein